MSFYTYAHYKPDGSIFYIGKGSDKRAHSANGRNIRWLRTVSKHGGFKVELLAKWDVEQEAFDHEIFLIDTFREMGHDLANIAKGGYGSGGFRHTEEHKAGLTKRMLAHNPMANAITRQKQLAALKLAMRRPEVRKHQSAVRMGVSLSEKHIANLRLCHPMRACVINGVEYVSLMEASRASGIRHGTLFRWFNNPEVKHTAKFAHIIEARWL